MKTSINTYFVYIVQCNDNTLYTGITKNLEKRIHEHNHLAKGAKYTRVRRPVELVYFEESENRSTASKREYSIKKLTREKKLTLINEKESKNEYH